MLKSFQPVALRLCFGLALSAGQVLAAPTASPDRLRERTAILSADDFEGRSPGTAGEEKTVTYLTNEMVGMGLEPGNPDGSYLQDVGLVGITSQSQLTFKTGPTSLTPTLINDYIAISRRSAEHVANPTSEVIFLGYGVQAPEFDWDDFKGVDVRGKTIVVLVNDPPVPDPAHPGQLDPAVFNGRAMTYYGRYDYKYEIASQLGAAACLIVHETGPAGYPFAVLTGSLGRENFGLDSTNGNADRVALEGWITRDFAETLFAASGHNFATLKTAAAQRDFQPVSLGASLNFQVTNTVRHIASQNVIGLLPGRDPKLRNEYVIYTAHWDHIGRDDRLSGDQIFNGAMDNASGLSAMLEMAQMFTDLPADQRPRRSILFLAVTAEERGLLGSRYYAEHPLYPLNHTVANINKDGANIYAPTHDIEVIGSGANTLEDLAAAIAAADHRVLVPDSEPEKGYYYRSDHFCFAKVGVPAFYAKGGQQAIGHPADYIATKRKEFTATRYHKVGDEIQPDWDFGAVAQEAEFLFRLGQRVADSDTWPTWKAGSEFKAIREASLR